MQFWNRQHPYQYPELMAQLAAAATSAQSAVQPAVDVVSAAVTGTKEWLAPVLEPAGEFLGGFTGDTTSGLVKEAVPAVVAQKAVIGSVPGFMGGDVTQVVSPAVAGAARVPAEYTTAAAVGQRVGQVGKLATLGTGIATAAGAFLPDVPGVSNKVVASKTQRAEEQRQKKLASYDTRIVTGSRNRKVGARLGNRNA
jgi:hypothetical protein